MEQQGTKRIVRQGAAAAWPICLGYVPIGLAFGVLAQKAGLTPFDIALMSVLVFAGSAQFIGVYMLQAGAGPLPIIATTFMVNLRHVLMSSSLARYMPRIPKRWLSLYAYGVTDESFAVNLVRFQEGGWGFFPALAANHVANLTWIAATVAGGYMGELIPPGAFGIDYALAAMFIGLLVFQLKDRQHWLAALVAGGLAALLARHAPYNLHVMAGCVAGATAGFAAKRSARGGEEA